MKGIIEVEFVKVGNVDFKLVESDPEVQRKFKYNWDKIVALTDKMLVDFFKKYKIKIKMTQRIEK